MPIDVIYGVAGSYISVMCESPASRSPAGIFQGVCGVDVAVFKNATATTGFLYTCVETLWVQKTQ